MHSAMVIEIMGHHFQLLPQKAILWKEEKTLLISDLHLGKITHFRKAGIAIPSIAYKNNFARLDELVIPYNAERIFFLGDLFHSRYNDEWEQFVAWRKKYDTLDVRIVLGNHDVLPLRLYDEINISVYDEFREKTFVFTHHPGENLSADEYLFCGHIHPVYCLRSPAKQSMKLPCFVFDRHQAILPSFGVFTGGYEMKEAGGRRIYVIAGDKIHGT